MHGSCISSHETQDKSDNNTHTSFPILAPTHILNVYLRYLQGMSVQYY